MLEEINHNLACSGKYIVRIAQNEDDIRAAQRLRFKVFNVELGEGLESAYEQERDVDKFDGQCHHLLIVERESDNIIGTYRMQTYDMAKKSGHGFYTAVEFQLQNIPWKVLSKGVEVGRACVSKEHRNGRVLFLLWRGLAEYMNRNKARYLFGCCSITSQNIQKAWEIMDYLKHSQKLHSLLMVHPTDSFQCPETGRNSEAWKDVALPQLFRLYMNLGAKVCSLPALDKEFKTIDYLILLDIEKLDERTRLLFFE